MKGTDQESGQTADTEMGHHTFEGPHFMAENSRNLEFPAGQLDDQSPNSQAQISHDSNFNYGLEYLGDVAIDTEAHSPKGANLINEIHEMGKPLDSICASHKQVASNVEKAQATSSIS